MALLTLSPLTTINAVALPSSDSTNVYYTKNNLTEQQGSYMTEATMLVYDEILRYQRNVAFTNGLDEAAIAAFDFDAFAGNAKWLMDELVGMESDWIKDASPGIEGNTAYGYVQFTEDTVETAVNRYRYHIEKFNSRSILGRRDWQPRGYKNSSTIFGGTKMKYPKWFKDLEYKLNSHQIGTMVTPATYDHKTDLLKLTYDQTLALAFVHLHGKNSKDYNFVQLAKGDVTAAKEIYKKNHHTDPDDATLARMEKFFQIH
jgi:hypothetical protein